ncbi:uncharacterized protein BYT42DRAFT_572982 [Radiomyces spectabilis]|uniref:uncharacterized protein n=1 Tax=Radiomyces spectabilis TaxID=64574 RepID=UPI0022211961|nr:uncharacterized protein BYT42DRAFT_572982 [Radiomyces spectabilis]KAI8375985.1 hypothetical protein BYT42DRAFT_572982 [Radiomyces spectabilis]
MATAASIKKQDPRICQSHPVFSHFPLITHFSTNFPCITMTVPESSFPIGYFYIISKMNNLVMDIRDPANAGVRSKIVMAAKKPESPERDTQLWIHQNGFLTNKATGLVLDIHKAESFIAIFTGENRLYLDNMKEQEMANDQRFGFEAEPGYIYALSDPNIVADIHHENPKEDARCMVYKRKPVEQASNQLWTVELADPPKVVDSDDESEDDGKRARFRAWFENWHGWGNKKKEVLDEKYLDKAHKKVYKEKKSHVSYELLAGAVAFEAVNAWERKQKEDGKEVQHKLAKQLIASVAAAELAKMFAERGNDDDSDDEDKKVAKKSMLERMAVSAATNYFEAKHGL